MPEYDLATPAQATEQATATSTSSDGAEYGYNSDQQCALEEGCDGDVPPLDEVFWEGFTDEHGGLVGDVVDVTAFAAELEAKVPSEAHVHNLRYHADGIDLLEGALNEKITTAQAGSSYDEDGQPVIDEAAVDAAMDTWDRLEVALDLLREYNGMYSAVLAEDFAGKLETFSSLAAGIVEAALDRSIEESAKRAQEKQAAFDEAWKRAAVSVAKIPADVAVDVAVGAAITAAVPVLLGAAGVTGTLPAVAVAAAIAVGASMAWNAVTDPWGQDAGGLHEGIKQANSLADIGTDATAIEQVGQGFKSGAEQAGKVSLGLTVLLDAVETGVAIDGIYEAQAAWEAFEIERKALMEIWDQAAVLYGNFARFAAQMKSGAQLLDAKVEAHRANIDALDAIYGATLFEV